MIMSNDQKNTHKEFSSSMQEQRVERMWLCSAKKKRKYNKRGGWRCGRARLVSTFQADNKACLCLGEPLLGSSFHNPRPHGLCSAELVCRWIKVWAEWMDWCGYSRGTHCKGVSFHCQDQSNQRTRFTCIRVLLFPRRDQEAPASSRNSDFYT